MNEVILFPDAQAVICGLFVDAFADRVIDVPVVTRVPNPRPDSFVLVRRVGGTRLHLVADDAMLSIEVWADLDEDAHDLCQLARSLLYAAQGEVLGTTVLHRTAEVGGPVMLPDPVSEQPRFVFTALVALRGTAEVPGS